MKRVDAIPNTSHDDPLEGISPPLFRAAARRIAQMHREQGTFQPHVSSNLRLLSDAIAAARRGVSPAVVAPTGRPGLGHLLLSELRAMVVAEWQETDVLPDAAEIVEILHAFEEVSLALSESSRGRALRVEDGFAEKLSGSHGLELVVEVAHDLRSPLTSILFLAEMLQRGQSGSVTDLQHRQLGLVYSAALGLSTLASNVMEMARGGSRLTDDQVAPFSVPEMLESVADIVRPMAEEKGLAIRLRSPKNGNRVGPPQALSRVLLNLTSNAIKFTEEGFVEIVAAETSERGVEFSVRDSGRGIPLHARETLFMPFRPGPEPGRTAFSGTGLGLALCRRLVRAMGSDLEFETEESWGTRFYFTLELPCRDN
jgi:signal transduction histidine kinase